MLANTGKTIEMGTERNRRLHDRVQAMESIKRLPLRVVEAEEEIGEQNARLQEMVDKTTQARDETPTTSPGITSRLGLGSTTSF